MNTKTCCRCKTPLPLSSFNLDSGKADGFDVMCRACRKEQKADYYRRNRDKVIAKVSEYQRQNPDNVNERNRRSYRRNRETRQAYQATYYAQNREIVNQRVSRSKARNRTYYAQKSRQWFKENPTKAAEYQAARRARKLASPEIEAIDRMAIYERDAGICQLCGLPVDLSLPARHPMRFTLDHIIPLARGGPHTMANLQTAHGKCNSRKSAKLLPR